MTIEIDELACHLLLVVQSSTQSGATKVCELSHHQPADEVGLAGRRGDRAI
jgi:hypothetical protein